MTGGRKALLGAAVLALAALAAVALRPVPPAPGAADAATPPAGPDAATAATSATAAEAREAVVAAVTGTVERLRGPDWAPVKVGDTVKAEDSLRTGPAGRADLEIGASSRLTVSEETQVKVAELTAAVHRLKIRRGRVAAAYQADGNRVLRIEGEDGGPAAEARAANFSVRATGTTFAVATETGTVDLSAAGTTVVVGAGQQSVSEGSRAPSPAAPIPANLLLKVAAAATAHQRPCSVIEGAAPPGSEVRVEDQPVALDPDGKFRVALEGPERREVRVVVRDVLGRAREERLACASRAARDGGAQPIENLNIKWE